MKTETEPKPKPDGPRSAERTSTAGKLKHLLIGKPRDLRDRSIFHRLSLIPFLAWVGMGADGLSSSAYGPEEAFRALGEHRFLAAALAVAMVITVFVISAGYSRIIEAFPHGGGGYLVATKLLGPRVGVVSGCALLVDYILTITVSIAAAGDALFSFLPLGAHAAKLPVEAAAILALIILNARGVRESILVLTPIFLVFLLTHAVLIAGTIGTHLGDLPAVVGSLRTGYEAGHQALGTTGLLLLLLHAYSLGGGTYTGIEAVSNGLPLMREPRVHTGKRTMLYMAVSLAFTASGLLLCYLLTNVTPVHGKTLNAVLIDSVAGRLPWGGIVVLVTLLSEGALLVVAAQAGFIDGPRVIANMAVDSWMPRRFAALSERLTTQNGIVLMGIASLLALLGTRGVVHTLVIMYSINVFLTFTLSMLGMVGWCWHIPEEQPRRKRGITLFTIGTLLCSTILVVTIIEKFQEGGWVTLLVTGSLIAVCFLIHRHYRSVTAYLAQLDAVLDKVPPSETPPPELDPTKPTAAVLVASYGGLGIHTILNIFRAFPGHFHNLLFISVGVTDSGQFKGERELKALRDATRENLEKYVDLAHRLGVPATYRWGIGTDAVAEAETLCLEARKEFHKTVFFAGQVIFQLDKWYHRALHNHTAFAVQKRLQLDGITMVILPVRVRGLGRKWKPHKAETAERK
ncbi:MAG: APC family permease [Planctomycetes bacterium]|nr:APC family permease [Planctomycetota bacterium]